MREIMITRLGIMDMEFMASDFSTSALHLRELITFTPETGENRSVMSICCTSRLNIGLL